MPSTLKTRPQAHLGLWQRFHDALARDTQRLALVLPERRGFPTRDLTTWWDRFAPAVTQCVNLATKLYGPDSSRASARRGSTPSPLLSDAIEAMGLAIGGLSAGADPEGGREQIAATDRVELAHRSLGLVRRHQADTVEYLTRSVAPDAYRRWERGAISALTYRHVSFLAPWLLDELSTEGRAALLRDVPHVRSMRCDEVWMRRYRHVVTAAIGPPGHRPDAARA